MSVNSVNEKQSFGLLEKLVEAALERNVLVLVFSLGLLIAGVWAYNTLRVDAVPDVSNVQVTVTTSARGLAPLEVEQYITYPVELALQSLPRLVLQRSVSKYALSQVTAVFEDGTDIYWARQQVNERLRQARENIPANISVNMTLGPIATGLGEVYQFEIRGDGYTPMQLREMLDWHVNPVLKTVPGVDEVQSMGGQVKEYQVWLNPERMHGYHISIGQVLAALSENNANAGGGYLLEGDDQILLRGEGMLTSTKDIGNVVVKKGPAGGGVVRVRDIGECVIGSKLAQSSVTQNGSGPTVIGIVIMRKGESTKAVVDAVDKKLEEISATLPDGVSVKSFYNRIWLVDKTIDTVWHNLAYGALLVLVVLFLLLGGVRGGIIAALAIPMALSGSLIFLRLTGTSANLLSLGAIDFGILIDGSVVMVENIICKLAARPSGIRRLQAVKAAASEVAAPVFFAILIITIVYLPVLFLPGVSGKTFQPMALTVIFGLLTALAIALFVTPSLTYSILPAKLVDHESLLIRILKKPYRSFLLVAVRHPIVVGTFSLLLFSFSLICFPLLGSEFIPVLKEGSVVLTINRPMSGSLKTADQQTTLVEKIIKEVPEVAQVLSRTGHSEIAFDPMGSDETDTFVIFKDRSLWRSGLTQQDIESDINNKLKRSLPGICFSISQPIEQRMNELVAGSKGDIAVRIFGPNTDRLRELGGEVAAVLSKVSGASDMKLEQTAGLPTMTARLDPTALAGYGVSVRDALDAVSAAQDGKVVGVVFEGKPRFDLSVRFDPAVMKRGEDLASLPVMMTGGDLVPLGQVARILRREGAAQISHRQGDRFFTVQTNVRGRDLGGYVEEAQTKVESIKLPPGYRIEWGGQFENMKAAQDRLMVLVPMTLLMIFALLYALFDSVRPGLIVFLNIPLAFSGGIFALLLRGMPFSVTAAVGFIALFGVAVMNGVVLVSTILQMEKELGIKSRQAAILSARRRLRPVLMTAMVASFGFLPMAFASSVGAEVQRPLATVVIGGLITSTLLTLIVLPSIYSIMTANKKNQSSSSAK